MLLRIYIQLLIRLMNQSEKIDQLWRRAIAFEVGQFGFVLEEHKQITAEQGIRPLNFLQIWLLLPMIHEEKRIRRACLDEAEQIVLN